MNKYIIYNLVRVYTAITQSVGGAFVDPTTVTLYMKTPDGVITNISSSIVKDSVGNYHADYLPTQFGIFTYQWLGSGVVEVCDIRQFQVVGKF